MKEHSCNIVKASKEVVGRDVKNHADENLGSIKEVMLDKESGHVAYVVLESGSFLGIGGKYFALPWRLLNFDEDESCFRVNIDKERFKNAPGFDKDNWPDMANRTWGESLHSYYGTKPYWEP
jgi:sporulation protein YlmC with PRC-barrel domain